jgi:hypothetical protein
MRQLPGVLVGAALVLLVAPPAGQVDVTRLGPQVGERVPGVGLVDHLGRAQTLQSLAGPKGTMLLFFRSADW